MNSRKLIGIISSVFLILVLAVVPLISACTPAEPEGELIVVFPTLGGEVWGPGVGGGIDDDMLAITNETLLSVPYPGDDPWYTGELAESWEMSADGLTWDFYLRQGIQFHDGWGEFTANDVIYSWGIVAREDSRSGMASDFRMESDGGNIKSFEIIDDYHVRVHLVAVNIQMDFQLAGEAGAMVSKDYFESVGYDQAIQNPIGTGPWEIIEHQPAEFVKYEAVENHWRQTPEFKFLTIRGIPELSTQLAMAKTGAADIIEIPADRKSELLAAGLHITSRAGGGTAQVLLGGNVLPTRAGYDPTVPWVMHQDEEDAVADFAAGWGKVKGGSEWNQRALKVRMAMQYAINADAIIDNIFYGEAVKNPVAGGGGWAPVDTINTRSDWEAFPYDPELAKELLIEAGYPDGFEFRYLNYASERQPRLGEVFEAVARDWEAIGLTPKRENVDYAVQRPWFGDRESAWMIKLDAYAPWWEPWSSLGFTNSSKNDSYNDGLESLELDVLIEATEVALTVEDRREAGLELGDWLRAHYTELAIALTSRVFALSPKVEDWPINIAPWSIDLGGYEYVTRAD